MTERQLKGIPLKKIIGKLMLAAPFVAIFVGYAYVADWKVALMLFVAVAFIVAWVAIGCWMAE